MLKLWAAIAAAGTENVPGKAFAVNADEGAVLGVEVAFDEGDVVLAVQFRAIEVQIEIAVIGGHLHHFDLLDKFFAGAAVLALVLWNGASRAPDPVTPHNSFEDLDLIVTSESFELLEDLEFYEWVAATDASGASIG